MVLSILTIYFCESERRHLAMTLGFQSYSILILFYFNAGYFMVLSVLAIYVYECVWGAILLN